MSSSNVNQKKQHKVAIVNYGVGNLFSVRMACELNELKAVITHSAKDIEDADAVILPGVGAFSAAMETLRRLHLIDVIKESAFSGKPFMGICLGMQLLLEKSFEFGEHKGLGIINGNVIRFDSPHDEKGDLLKVPQVGWNRISIPKRDTSNDKKWKGTFLEKIDNNELMYFVHSYYVKLVDEQLCLSMTRYGDVEFCSSLQYNNIFACQFHPERSADSGLSIYKALAESLRKTVEV